MFVFNAIAAAVCFFWAVEDLKDGDFGFALAGLILAAFNVLCLFI